MVTVFLVDDHEVVRRGLIDLLSADADSTSSAKPQQSAMRRRRSRRCGPTWRFSTCDGNGNGIGGSEGPRRGDKGSRDATGPSNCIYTPTGDPLRVVGITTVLPSVRYRRRRAPPCGGIAALRAPTVEAMIKSPPTTPAAVQWVLPDCRDVGMDEAIAYPTIADLQRVHRLAEVVHGCPGL
jgi:hypothetical protein